MSADFWAGYLSGAIGIIIGNPLDVLKVRLQASSSPSPSPLSSPAPLSSTPSSSSKKLLTAGTAAPILGYGALNALLFVSYNRTEAALNSIIGTRGTGSNLWTTWLAGAVGGLATWVVSTPTELIKCRAQLAVGSPPPPSSLPLPVESTRRPHGYGTVVDVTDGRRTSKRFFGLSSSSSSSSWAIAKQTLRTQGIRGLYVGGVVTALRDSIGYGFYFWGYELCSRAMRSSSSFSPDGTPGREETAGAAAARVLLCGGIAGIITWASIFPLDVIKTRVQTQNLAADRETARKPGAWEVTKKTYREGGIRPFFRGLGVCSARAFVVNAVQWAVYEWIMMQLGEGRGRSSREKGQGQGEVVGIAV